MRTSFVTPAALEQRSRILMRPAGDTRSVPIVPVSFQPVGSTELLFHHFARSAVPSASKRHQFDTPAVRETVPLAPLASVTWVPELNLCLMSTPPTLSREVRTQVAGLLKFVQSLLERRKIATEESVSGLLKYHWKRTP